jgi:hypothetical protein
MRRFVASDEPSTWSPSWQAQWGGSGGPVIILFAEPEFPPPLLLRSVLARFARRRLVLADAGGATARSSSVGRSSGAPVRPPSRRAHDAAAA